MQLLRRLDAPAGAQGFVATAGGFDGLHRGHLELVRRVRAAAATQGLRSLVVSFEPLPREYFSAGDPPGRLTSFRERWRLLEREGLDAFCVLPFNRALQNQSAQDFAESLARGGLQHVLVGHDFRAGKGAAGDVEFLRGAGRELGFTVDVMPPLCDGESASAAGRCGRPWPPATSRGRAGCWDGATP